MIVTPFYHASTRKLIAVFGNLFNDIHVIREDASSVQQNDIKVPLSYGPQNGWYAKLQKDYASNDPNIQLTLPRMTFEIDGFQYDSARKISTFGHKESTGSSADHRSSMRNAVPYNVGLTLSIASKNTEDALQCLEQILPFFQPDFNIPINFVPGFDAPKDVSFVLESVSPEDNYEEGFTDNRLIIWTLSFTAKSWIFSPIADTAIIKKKIMKLGVDLDENGDYIWAESITTEVDPITAEKDDVWVEKQTITDLL